MSESITPTSLQFSGPEELRKPWFELAQIFINPPVNPSLEADSLYRGPLTYRIAAVNTLNDLVFGSKRKQEDTLREIYASPNLTTDLCDFAYCLSQFARNKTNRPLQDAIVASIAHHWISAEKRHGLYPPPSISNGEGVALEEKEKVLQLRKDLLNTPEGGFLYGFLFSVAHSTLQNRIATASRILTGASGSFDYVHDITTEKAYKLYEYSTFKFEENKGSKFIGYVDTYLKQSLFHRIKEIVNEKVLISLDAPLTQGESGDLTLGDSLKDERQGVGEALIQSDMAAKSLEILHQMKDPRVERIIRERLGLDGSKPKTLEEVSKGLNITRERVRQIEAKGLKKIRERLHAVTHESDPSKGTSLGYGHAKKREKNKKPSTPER